MELLEEAEIDTDYVYWIEGVNIIDKPNDPEIKGMANPTVNPDNFSKIIMSDKTLHQTTELEKLRQESTIPDFMINGRDKEPRTALLCSFAEIKTFDENNNT